MGSARLDTPIDFVRRDVDVAIRCGGCGRVRYLTAEQLGTIFGLAARVPAMERRLRCTACNHRGARLAPVPRLARGDVDKADP